MNEIVIKRHSFDLAKNRLKEFSEKTEAKLEIDKVRTNGGFLGFGDHKVTGDELNRRLETIQEHFIAVNTTNNKVIKEFREVYNTFDILDKDYITSIVANVKAIEKTSNDVRVQQGTLKQHNEKLANQQSKLDAHQAEIEKNVANISKIVTALKVFKEKLEGYKHLMEVDKIWKQTEEHQTRINRVEQECKANTDKLSGISHLDDVDEMWNSVEEHTSKLIKCEKRDEELADAIQKNKEEVNENIAEAVRAANAAIETLTKKVKYAYWIAGGSAGLAIVELILLLMKVI